MGARPPPRRGRARPVAGTSTASCCDKRNTFTDFIASAEHLVAQGYGAPDRVTARGGSAGGLLVGACVTLRPDLFAGVVAAVPFVDVVTTMRDPSIPLTVTEWDEWGDPRAEPYASYMLGYSPYDNVAAGGSYPALYVTAGLNDPRVMYHEPAKWVAKLRATARRAARCCCAPRWAPGTAARRVATRSGGTRPGCWPSSWSRPASPAERPAEPAGRR